MELVIKDKLTKEIIDLKQQHPCNTCIKPLAVESFNCEYYCKDLELYCLEGLENE